MASRSVLGITLILLFASILVVSTSPAKPEPSYIVVPDDYPTIQEAVNNANEGDTIFVRSGVYRENITIERDAISLIGDNSEATKIYCSNTNTITVASKNVSITGFTIMSSGLYSSAVLLGMYTEITAVAYNCSIFGNNIVDSYCGVMMPNSGIVQEMTGNSVSSNIIINNSVGVDLGVDCDFNTVSENTVVSNDEGIMIESSNNVIFDNYISENQNGVHIVCSEVNNAFNNVIKKNRIVNNQIGLLLELVAGLVGSGFSRTSFYESQEFRYARLYHNNFMQNMLHVASGWSGLQCAWDNGFEGNFWDDYNGKDASQDGIGDAPYVIDADNQDNYPLMKPYLYADVNHDGRVDMRDIGWCALKFGSRTVDPDWRSSCDINEDGLVDIQDIGIALSNFGMKYP